MAVDEVLDPAGGSDVVFVAVLGELEGGAELGVQFVGVVAHDRQAAAFGRAVGGVALALAVGELLIRQAARRRGVMSLRGAYG